MPTAEFERGQSCLHTIWLSSFSTLGIPLARLLNLTAFDLTPLSLSPFYASKKEAMLARTFLAWNDQ